MTPDGKGSGAKVALIVAAVVVVLGLVCCVGGYMIGGEWFRAGVSMGQEMAKGTQALDASFADAVGADAVWALEQHGNAGMALIVGVPEVPADEAEIVALQDAAWELYAESFAEGGPPLTGVAIGRAVRRVKQGGGHQGQVAGWQENFASAETLEERTGVAPPPVSEFFRKVYALQRTAEDQAYEDIDGGGEGE